MSTRLSAGDVDRDSGGWRASLSLSFERRGARTVLGDRHRRGPLAVQRSFYPEGHVCHVYLLHPPAGVVGGDGLHVLAKAGAGAAALVTTPGATRFYRSAGPRAQVRQTLSAYGGVMEWFPQENIFFPGADVDLETTVNLDGTGQFLGWEIHCLGRPVLAERFDTGRVVFRLALRREGRPLLLERLVVEKAADLDSPTGLRGLPVVGTLVATGADDSVVRVARTAVSERTDVTFGITRVDDVLLARCLGNSTEGARKLLIAVWEAIRPLLLGRSACAPRIWAT